MKETPFQIISEREIQGRKVKISNIMELCQGGPEVGELSIDGSSIQEKHRFGGPVFSDSKAIYLPVYTKSFFKTGFKLARIEIYSGHMEIKSELFPLIHILGIENGEVKFATDASGNDIQVVKLDSVR